MGVLPDNGRLRAGPGGAVVSRAHDHGMGERASGAVEGGSREVGPAVGCDADGWLGGLPADPVRSQLERRARLASRDVGGRGIRVCPRTSVPWYAAGPPVGVTIPATSFTDPL